MRITFVLAGGFTLAGGQRVIANLARCLQACGHEVFVVSQPKRPPSLREQLHSARHAERIRLPTSERSHFDYLGVPHHLIERCRPIVDEDVPDADVVIATWWETAEWVALLAPRKGAKAYLIQHHEVFDVAHQARVEATYSLLLHKIVTAPWLADLMSTRYGDVKVSVVSGGVDLQLFNVPPRGKQIRPAVGMLYHGMPLKGCEVGLKAFALAAEQVPNLHLVAFGESGPLAGLPLPGGTEFFRHPAQTAIKDIYAKCDIWMCSSWSEGFHLPPLEAMACRCPVVSTRVGGPQELVQDGINGYLVPPGDVTALADRLARVLTLSGEEWTRMSEAAYRTAQQYSWERMTERFEQALHGLLC